MAFLLINNPVFRPITKGSVLWSWGRGRYLGTYFPSRVKNSPGQGLRGRKHDAHRFLRAPMFSQGTLWRGSYLGTYFPSRVNNSPGQGLRGRKHDAHRFIRAPMFSQGTLLTSSGIHPERLSHGFEQSWEFSPSCCVSAGGQAPPRLRHMPPRGAAREGMPACRPPDPGRPIHSGLPGLQHPQQP